MAAKATTEFNLVAFEDIPDSVRRSTVFRDHALKYWWTVVKRKRPERLVPYTAQAEKHLQEERANRQQEELIEIEQLSPTDKVLHLRARVQELERELQQAQTDIKERQGKVKELEKKLTELEHEKAARKRDNYLAKQRAKQRKRKVQDGGRTASTPTGVKVGKTSEYGTPATAGRDRCPTPGAGYDFDDDDVELGLSDSGGASNL